VLVCLVAGSSVWGKVKRTTGAQRRGPAEAQGPGLRPLFQKIALARFARNLGHHDEERRPRSCRAWTSSPTPPATSCSRGHPDVQESVRTGESLPAAADHPVFPPMVVQMMAVGEDTGRSTPCCRRSRSSTTRRSRRRRSRSPRCIEPLMIAFLGGIVGGMIVALYMPIFKIFELIE
jgi:type IV pilus assembly protein PilC